MLKVPLNPNHPTLDEHIVKGGSRVGERGAEVEVDSIEAESKLNGSRIVVVTTSLIGISAVYAGSRLAMMRLLIER